LAPSCVEVMPSVAVTLKVADPKKFEAGVNVMPLRAALALAMVAVKLMLAVPSPLNEARLPMLANGNAMVPWVAVTVTVRVPVSVSLTVTPVMDNAVSSKVVRIPPTSVTMGTSPGITLNTLEVAPLNKPLVALSV